MRRAFGNLQNQEINTRNRTKSEGNPDEKRRVEAIPEDEAVPMEWEQSEPDIDDSDDPDMCGEYCKDIFKNEKKREIKWIFAKRLPEKETKMRTSCVDWLTEVCFTWRLATDTLFVAVLFLDKTLRTIRYTLDDMQALAGTCLFLAAKVEEVEAIPIRDIVEISPGTSVSLIKKLEKKILDALDYELITPHPMLFIRRYNSVSGADMQLHNITKYLATLVVRHQGHCCGMQSQLAAAICFLSRRIAGYPEQEAWTDKMTAYTGHTPEDIKIAVYFVSHAIAAANIRAARYNNNPDKVATAYKVFGSRKFAAVSTNACMRQEFINTYSLLNVITLENS